MPPAPDPARQALAELVRDQGRRVLATLVRTVGDVGILRRERGRGAQGGSGHGPARPGRRPATPDSVVRDDLLRLVFTCCHPSLSLEAQVALSLRTLCGLSTAEVARALLVPEATMLKRLTRAKQKIRQARIPYRIPAGHELPDRLAGVAATGYLLFNEGYSASDGDDPLRADLADEALRLGRLLAELLQRLGRRRAAVAAYQSALALGVNEAQRRYLAGRLAEAAEAEVDLEAGDRVDDP